MGEILLCGERRNVLLSRDLKQKEKDPVSRGLKYLFPRDKPLGKPVGKVFYIIVSFVFRNI